MRRRQNSQVGTPTVTTWRSDPHGELLGEHTVRFRDPRHRHNDLPPFPAYVRVPVRLGPVPDVFTVRPRFADRAGLRLVEIPIRPGTSLYGTGEQAGPLLRNGTRKVCWNTDAFGYDDRSPSLYQSHPYVLAVRPDGSSFGVIAETTFRCVIDLSKTTPNTIRFECDGPSPAVTIIERSTPREVVQALAELTGFMPLPPLWSLGYQQCRWSYEPESKVRWLAGQFRERRIPCDVIWLDIDYMDRFRCFTFDKDKFPDPAMLTADLNAMGFRTVWMIDPGLAADPEYAVCRSGRAGGHFVTARTHEPALSSTISDELTSKWGVRTDKAHREGDEYHGRVWPGSCVFPDFTRSATRVWWSELYRDFLARGVDGVWNDMNEPAVFDGPGKTMPLDNHHDADADLGGPGPHARYHNIYGMQMVRATRAGMEAARPHSRPFVLTRSNFLGGHRYAATWTGDNTSDWRHLAWSISMALNMGLSGQPFVGPDIGGFSGNATPEMFARWMGIGSLLPFARGHTVKDSVDHEPWAFGEACERACRVALERRSRLIPYLYTLFWHASTTGLPVVRPAFFADVHDPRLRSSDDSFLLGDDVLARCDVHHPSNPAPSPTPAPAGYSRTFEIIDEAHGIGGLPVLHARDGAIIPLGPVRQHIGERPLDPLTLIVSPDASGSAVGRLYEDAGDGYEHRRGDYLVTTYRARLEQGRTIVEVADEQGDRRRPARKLVVRLLGDIERHATGTDGTPLVV